MSGQDQEDGFTQPARTHPEDEQQEEADYRNLAFAGENIDCRNCEHYDVCAYHAEIRPIVEEPKTGDGQESPFEAHDLAAICDYFEAVDEQ